MKLHIDKLILNLINGTNRELPFYNNKINIITGNSDTGKSLILEIIDYILFGNSKKIINTEVSKNCNWYALNLTINDKNITIARGKILDEKGSKDYYYSSIGEVPKQFKTTIDEDNLKKIIENEFSIDENARFSYGGKTIKKDSKISLRFFLLFNTLSGDVIDHSTVFFDKQEDERYKEALERIFDLAIGIDTIENSLIYKKIKENEEKIQRLNMEKNKAFYNNEQKNKLFEEIKSIAFKNNIIPNSTSDNKIISLIREKIKNDSSVDETDNQINRYEKIQYEIRKCQLEINKINDYKKKIDKYKEQLKDEELSIEPIRFLMPFIDNIDNDEYRQFIKQMEENLQAIKASRLKRKSFEINFDQELNNLISEKNKLYLELSKIPNPYNNENKSIYYYYGVLQGKIELYNEIEITNHNKIDLKIKELETDNQELLNQHIDVADKKQDTINKLNSIISRYILKCPKSIEPKYQYTSLFNYKDKQLNFIEGDKFHTVISNTSSSVCMYRHLLLFIGLHTVVKLNAANHVAPFFILDQPSRPYFNSQQSNISEESIYSLSSDFDKTVEIFELLNCFINNLKEIKEDFQIIVFEHIPSTMVSKMENVIVIEEFDGIKNALIPPSMTNKN